MFILLYIKHLRGYIGIYTYFFVFLFKTRVCDYTWKGGDVTVCARTVHVHHTRKHSKSLLCLTQYVCYNRYMSFVDRL